MRKAAVRIVPFSTPPFTATVFTATVLGLLCVGSLGHLTVADSRLAAAEPNAERSLVTLQLGPQSSFESITNGTTTDGTTIDGASGTVRSTLKLRGAEAQQQLQASRIRVGSPPVDITHEAVWESSDPSIVAVNASGRVRVVGDGVAVVTARDGDLETRLEVEVTDGSKYLPLNFTNEILPVLTKSGCSSGACHGKSEGRNGFRLSLLGFDPQLDYDSIVKQAHGRRALQDVPEESLLLRKPSGKLPHEGGQLLDSGGSDYKKLLRWIRSGLPWGEADDPVVTTIEISPVARVLAQDSRQQLTVTAIYSDGRREDATRLAQYMATDTDLIDVSETGLVRVSGDLSGESAVMVRYQSLVTTSRLTVPLGHGHADLSSWEPHNFIDEHTAAKFEKLGLTPSALSTDEVFLRRVYLDLCGTLPTLDESVAFLAERDAGKRERLINALLERPEHASFFALKWGDILRNRRDERSSRMRTTYTFHRWLRGKLVENVPYDRIVRELLTARGEALYKPPVSWYRELATPELLADDVAQVFLGTRIQCARCHHHPFERWSQADYYGMVSFFTRLGRKRYAYNGEEPVLFLKPEGLAVHPKTGDNVLPKPLGGETVQVGPTDDPREALAAWITAPDNPYFARALTNRMWAHFFGRGFCEPLDDMRATNPPSHPELLDALAADFVDKGFDLKHLMRRICNSRTYQLSSTPNERNLEDRSNFSRFPPQRLQAEVLLDAISAATGTVEKFPGLPAGTRAIELPDEHTTNKFLMLFGKPKRASSCECERPSGPSLGQSVHLLNSEHVEGKIEAPEGLAARLAADPRAPLEKVTELYLIAFSRRPTTGEARTAVDYVHSAPNEPEAYQDLLWSLLNTKEFQFTH